MIKINIVPYNSQKKIEKSKLYKVSGNCTVQFIEEQKFGKDIVNLEYHLEDEQYGIYANEYRRPDTLKDGGKVADILACVVDERKKEIDTYIFDVKRNISAFSDDLLKESAMITAIKEVRDFIKQLHAEMLHKESFLLYYKDDGYKENMKLGIVTSSFEPEKFKAVAEKLENFMTNEANNVPSLVSMKLKNNLRPYATEIEPLYNFSEKKIVIRDNVYPLYVFTLQKINETDYEANINIKL